MLVRDSISLFYSEIIQVVLGLGILAILANDLEQSRYGLWLSVLAVFQLVNIVDFGFSTYVVREVPGNVGTLHHILRKIRVVQVIILFSSVSICTYAVFILFEPSDISHPPLALLSIPVASTILAQLNRASLRALGRAKMEIYVSIIEKGITLLFLLVCKYYLPFSELFYLTAYVTGPLAGFASSYVILLHIIRGLDAPILNVSPTPDIIRESLPYTVDLLVRPLTDGAIRLLILLNLGAASVAIFEIAWRVFLGGNSASRSARKAMMPVFSSSERTTSATFQESFKKAFSLVCWIVPLGMLVGVAVAYAIPIIFSPEYADSTPIFLTLLASWSALLLYSPWQVTVQAILPGKNYTFLVFSGALVQVVSAIILIPTLDLIGASLSVFLSHLTMATVSFGIIKKSKIKSDSELKALMLIFLMFIFSLVLGGLHLNYFGPEYYIFPTMILLFYFPLSGWKPKWPMD